MSQNRLVLPAVIIAIAAVLSTFIISAAFQKIKSDNQTINATGSAKKVIVSDLAIFRGTITVEGSSASEAYQELQRQKPVIVNYLKGKGFQEEKLNFQTINNYPNYYYNQNGQQTGIRSYTASQTLDIQSADVELIKAISLDVSSLVQQGINFNVNPPEYYYTKIGDIKIEIQAEAAKDAMVRGQRIAEATGRKLGALKSARMGVIQITPENSNMISDYGINDVSSIRKEITAVVSAEFAIE